MALDELGCLLGHQIFLATTTGCAYIGSWIVGLGQVLAIGMEGTGSNAAGLFEYLRRQGLLVIEVEQPDRGARRKTGMSDPADAIAAARAGQGRGEDPGGSWSAPPR